MAKPRKPVPSYIPRTEPLAPPPPSDRPPLPAPVEMVAAVSRLLCPSCRHVLSTYGTARRGAVTVRYHRCTRCGANRIRTHETDGVVVFVGWAKITFPTYSRN